MENGEVIMIPNGNAAITQSRKRMLQLLPEELHVIVVAARPIASFTFRRDRQLLTDRDASSSWRIKAQSTEVTMLGQRTSSQIP